MVEKVYSINDLDQIATELLIYAKDQRKITFQGDLGTGKTTLIKSLCTHLGINEAITSPTFSIVNEYHSSKPSGLKVFHMDLYRLESLEEAYDIGIEDYLGDEGYCFIEWPALIEPLLPTNVLRVSLEIIEDSFRKISYF